MKGLPATAVCGKTHSRSGKPLTHISVVDHERNCPKCQNIDGSWITEDQRMPDIVEKFIGTPMRDLIDDDLPAGAYWALPGWRA